MLVIRRPPPAPPRPPSVVRSTTSVLVLRTKSKGCPPSGPHPLHPLLPPLFTTFSSAEELCH